MGLPSPPKGWLGSNISVAIGYTTPDGTNDIAIITPKGELNRKQLAQEAQAAWTNIQHAGTAAWVDGQPDTLIADIAVALSLPVGWPDGWLPDPTPPVDPNAPVDPVVTGG